jgi:hypothetical protein
MKKLAILICTIGVLTANAQTKRTGSSLESTATPRGKQTSGLSSTAKPNEIVKGDVAYSGIAVQVVKTRNPLQLVNPAAAPKYGSAEDNVLRDPTTGRASGLRIFSIRF